VRNGNRCPLTYLKRVKYSSLVVCSTMPNRTDNPTFRTHLSTDELKRRLRHRIERQGAGPSPSPAVTLARDILPSRTTGDPPHRPRRQSAGIRIEEATRGTVQEAGPSGRCFVIRSPVRDVDGAAGLDERFAAALRDDEAVPAAHLNALAPDRAPFRPEDLVFLDIESTGLSSSPLFLIGIMLWTRQGLSVHQFLARDYAEEAAVLRCYAQACRGRPLLVSFNGKSFDVPYIRARAAANAVRMETAPAHFDLLHVSRRTWGKTLPDCMLQTLESAVCGRRRVGDIPGCDIPEVYHAFVRTADAFEIVDVLQHNLLDLVTLADIMTHLPPPGVRAGSP